MAAHRAARPEPVGRRGLRRRFRSPTQHGARVADVGHIEGAAAQQRTEHRGAVPKLLRTRHLEEINVDGVERLAERGLNQIGRRAHAELILAGHGG